jgi:hypothetical protein
MDTIPPISSLWDPRNLITLISMLALCVLCTFALTYSSKRAKVTLLGLTLMVFPFLPASNLLFPVGFVVAERVLYLPSMGYCLIIALGAWQLYHSEKMLPTVTFLLILCCGFQSLKTIVRNYDWKNDNTLFRSAISVNPGNGKPYNNLGHDVEEAGDYIYAEKLFRMATHVQADDVGAFINHGRVLKQLGRFQAAEQVSH